MMELDFRRLQTIGQDSIMSGLAHYSLETWVWDKLNNVGPDELYKVIEENKPITLDEENLEWGKPLYKKFEGILEMYTVDYILARLQQRRNELYSMFINHPRGKQWLIEKREEIKQQLES